jgi:hypothetical protein
MITLNNMKLMDSYFGILIGLGELNNWLNEKIICGRLCF